MKKALSILTFILIGQFVLGQNNFVFNTPAYQGPKDLAGHPDSTKFFNAWDNYVNRYTVTSSTYNLSGGANNTIPGKYYVNPKDDPTFFTGAAVVPIRWHAFPGRVSHYLEPKLNALYSPKSKSGVDATARMFELVDIGPIAYQEKYKDDVVFIPKSPCDPKGSGLKMFDPIGPRGWLDEYCEMGVLKNPAGKIKKIHFTCENPEYYWTLWAIDPNLVLKIYRETLENDNIQLSDLYLRDENQDSVIVKATGRPAYNPINKWNNGTAMTANKGGAMHLTSSPNELSAEIVLAGGAALLRADIPSNKIANSLICCSQYGRRFRNSDPHIGQNVYQVVSKKMSISLVNPVGLYLQEPQYNYIQLPKNAPKGAKVEDCFRVVRGKKRDKSYPNNMILHLVMEVPSSWSSDITLSDFMVLGDPLVYGSQVLQTMEVQLAGAGKPAKKMQRRADCVTDNTTPSLDYLTDYNVLTASFYRNLSDSANVTSNILQVTQGTVASEVAIVISNIKATDAPNAVISFPNSNITVTKQEYLGPSNQEKLGNGPEKTYFYTLTLDIPADQAIGNYDVLIEVNNAGVPVPQMIQVIEN
jgi:hypothetical protein